MWGFLKVVFHLEIGNPWQTPYCCLQSGNIGSQGGQLPGIWVLECSLALNAEIGTKTLIWMRYLQMH